MLRSRRPSSSLRPRRPLRGAAAAEAERGARRQRRERLQRARPEGPGVGSALPRAWGAKPQPGRLEAEAVASPAGFLFLSEVCSPTPLLLLLRPPGPLPSLRPAAAGPATGTLGVAAEPPGALGGIFGPGGGAHWAQGRRGAWGGGSGRPIRERRPGAELGRGGATPGRPGHPGSRFGGRAAGRR